MLSNHSQRRAQGTPTTVAFTVSVMPLVVVEGVGLALAGRKGSILLVMLAGRLMPSSSCWGMSGSVSVEASWLAAARLCK